VLVTSFSWLPRNSAGAQGRSCRRAEVTASPSPSIRIWQRIWRWRSSWRCSMKLARCASCASLPPMTAGRSSILMGSAIRSGRDHSVCQLDAAGSCQLRRDERHEPRLEHLPDPALPRSAGQSGGAPDRSPRSAIPWHRRVRTGPDRRCNRQRACYGDGHTHARAAILTWARQSGHRHLIGSPADPEIRSQCAPARDPRPMRCGHALRSSWQLREICHNDWQRLPRRRDIRKRPVFNSFLLRGRER
jgi:hypothetical protein